MKRLLLAVAILVALGAPMADAAVPLDTTPTSLTFGSKAHGLHLVGTRAYVALENGMAIVNLQNPLAPALLGKLPASTALRSEAVVVSGDYAYLASSVSGLIVANVSNPAAPTVVTTRKTYGGLWDVAIKNGVIYGVSLYGEMYVFDARGGLASAPVQIKVLGLPAWASVGGDKVYTAKLRAGVTTGNARATGVTAAGDWIFAVEWAYGRLYAWDASDAANPVYAGTHYAPYVLKAVADVANDTVYMLSAFGTPSGIYTFPISKLDPLISTRHATCAECKYLKSLSAVDQGGLGAAPGFSHILWAGGKGLGEAHVVRLDTPTAMVDEVNGPLGSHGVAMAATMGLASLNVGGQSYLIITAGLLGLRVYQVPELAP